MQGIVQTMANPLRQEPCVQQHQRLHSRAARRSEPALQGSRRLDVSGPGFPQCSGAALARACITSLSARRDGAGVEMAAGLRGLSQP